MNYCGIDLATKTTAFCIIDEQDNPVMEKQVSTDPLSFRRALEGQTDLLCVVEAAPLAEWCQREIEALGHRCVITDTRAAKGLFNSRKKTDQRDARTLARMARTRWYKEVRAKSPEARLQRTRLQMRSALVGTRTSLYNAVLGLLRANAVIVGKQNKGSGFADKVRALLAPQPALLASVEPLLGVWQTTQDQLRDIDRQLHREARTTPLTQRLMKVPGVGKLGALGFVATMDDPHRFKNARQVGDYFGLAPGIYQSGTTEVRGRITRQGDVLMRTLLVEAANSILYRYRGDWSLKRWAQRLMAKKGAGKARVALARKLAILLWTLWKNEETFELRTA